MLDMIPTTAKAILKFYEDLEDTKTASDKFRYKNITAYVNLEDIEFESGVGCPHCLACGGCNECSWKDFPTTETERVYAEMCLTATFGGISYQMVEGHLGYKQRKNKYVLLTYSDYMEQVCFFYPKDVDPKTVKIIKRDIERIRKFVTGHIEWATTVLETKTR